MGIQRWSNFFKDRIYLAQNSSLVLDIIGQFHNSTHEGYHKTLQRIRANFYWTGKRRTVREFIVACDVCQRHKSEQCAPTGLLQPLPVPNQVWEDISMDFIDGLPASKGKTTIFVVVDRLSKYAHFISFHYRTHTQLLEWPKYFLITFSSYMGCRDRLFVIETQLLRVCSGQNYL